MKLSSKRSALWASLLVVALAIGSIQCLNEDKEIIEESPEEFPETSLDYAEGYEGESEGLKESEYPQGAPPPPAYPPVQSANYAPAIPVPPPPPYPVPNYSAPGPYVEAPPAYNQPEPIYAPPPPPPPPVYQQPLVNYSASYQTSYQPPTVGYQSLPQQTYQPLQQNYSAPVYQPPTVGYQSLPQQTYQPLQQNYSAPVYQPPTVGYQSLPQQTYQPLQQNYSSPVYQQQQQPKYQPVQQIAYQTLQSGNYSAYPLAQSSLGNRYSIADLVSLVSPFGYRSNHWSLFYYRSAPYRSCPKNIYLNAPSYKDIEAAFAYALQTILSSRNGIQYMNSSQPSFAARHQIFSFLSQLNARMDEEGLLLELVSQYLAERACLTKWDKQRYLPQLTKLLSVSNFPGTHSCSNLYQNQWQGQLKYCLQSRYRTYDGFCNNPYHPYWGKSNVCHIRLLSPDYADGISVPRASYNSKYPLPNPRTLSNYIHNDIPIDGPYNLMKMQWGQFINHDITNTALSSYDGLVDCCRNPKARGCWPIYVPPGDRFYGPLNVTCLNFIRSGVCPTCQLGPRQQQNKNTAFLDASHVYGNTPEQARALRTFRGGQLKFSVGKNGEILLPTVSNQEQCTGTCYVAGDSRVNQHPALTVLHTLLLRNHNIHARNLLLRHPSYSDELIFQEARRLNIAEFQMITYNEYLPIVFGPILSAYYNLIPLRSGYTYYDPKVDPTTWNEYSTATCRFGHSQVASTFGLYSQIFGYGQNPQQPSFRLKDWFMRPSILADGQITPMINGMLSMPSQAVDPWITNDVRNHLYQSIKEKSGGDLAATNIWRGREHGIPGYIHYVEYCFNIKIRNWRDLQLFIPYYTLNQMRKYYRSVEQIDLFVGGMAERHFPGADTGPTFACVNGIQYYHMKFGDRYYFEHGGQAGSFTPPQLAEIRKTTLARLLCRTAYLPAVPQYAFLAPSVYNPLINCTQVGEINYSIY